MRHVFPRCHPVETLPEQPLGLRPTGTRSRSRVPPCPPFKSWEPRCRTSPRGCRVVSAQSGSLALLTWGAVCSPRASSVCAVVPHVSQEAPSQDVPSQRRAPAPGVVLGWGWGPMARCGVTTACPFLG